MFVQKPNLLLGRTKRRKFMPLAQLPPMGWNSWNTFGWQINEQLIFEMADLMASQGYREAGYEYLVIDDCWSLRERGKDGRIVPDPEKFPHGMKAVADYVHSKGLKFGMYSCAGVRTCAGYPGSYDHEFVDAQTFADWGVDFLKYDFCNFPQSGNCKARYLTMSMALKATGAKSSSPPATGAWKNPASGCAQSVRICTAPLAILWITSSPSPTSSRAR